MLVSLLAEVVMLNLYSVSVVVDDKLEVLVMAMVVVLKVFLVFLFPDLVELNECQVRVLGNLTQVCVHMILKVVF